MATFRTRLIFRVSSRLVPRNPTVTPTLILPVNFSVQVDENGIATSAVGTVGECTTDVCEEL